MKKYNHLLCQQVSNAEKTTSSFRYASEPESSDFIEQQPLDTSYKHAGMTGVNIFNVFCLFLLYPSASYAHHSKEHMMLLENADQVIQNTQQGNGGGLFWLLYTGVFILLLLGFIRWWKNRS